MKKTEGQRLKAAFFDFDGTLTYGDTMVPFMISACGRLRFMCAVCKALPWLAGHALGLCTTQIAKEALFGACFNGWDYELFRSEARKFAQRSFGRILRQDVVARLKEFISDQDCVVAIVSSSMQEWIEPFFGNLHGIEYVTTRPEVNAARKLTGRFSSTNCKGPEKARRIREAVSDVDRRVIYAFGNSSGDREMLEMADYPTLIK